MKKLLSLLTVLVIIAVLFPTKVRVCVGYAAGLLETSPLPQGNNLTWIWDVTTVNEETLLGLERNKFNTVALESTLPSQETLSSFVLNAAKHNIKVEALMGDPAWVLKQNSKKMNQMVQNILDFNKSHTEKFSAIHLDIEPHSLSNWKGNEATILNDLYTSLVDVKRTIDLHNKRYGDKLALNVDIPYWYNYNIKGKSFFSLLETTVDKVVIMNYVTTAEEFLSNGDKILNSFTKDNKVILAADFVDPSVGFNNLSLDEFSKCFSTTQEKFGQNPKFYGIGIHDYISYTTYLSK